jgi:hypothetical protein
MVTKMAKGDGFEEVNQGHKKIPACAEASAGRQMSKFKRQMNVKVSKCVTQPFRVDITKMLQNAPPCGRG